MSDREKILVLGASGNVGSALTALLARDGFAVRAFYDPSGPQVASFDPTVDRHPGSFDDSTALGEAMRDVDAVFMLTPPSPSQPTWHRNIVEAARGAHVRRIVKLSAFDSGKDSALQMGRWHHDGEVAVIQSGLEYVILRPQYFMQMQLQPLRVAASTGVFRGAASPALRMGIVDVRDIAAVAAVALTSAAYAGETLVPTGPDAPSFDEIASALGAELGTSVRYERRSQQEIWDAMTSLGWPEWHIDDYLKIHGESASALVTTDVFRTTGRHPRSIVDLIREHAAEWASIRA